MVKCKAWGCENRSRRENHKKSKSKSKDSNNTNKQANNNDVKKNWIDNNNNNKNNNNNNNGKNSKRTLSFYRVPSQSKDKLLRKAWLDNIKERNNSIENFDICSDHFEPECFEKDLKVSQLFFISDNYKAFIFFKKYVSQSVSQ